MTERNEIPNRSRPPTGEPACPALFLAMFRDGDVLRVARVQHHGNETRRSTGRRILRHAVQTARRFIERLTSFEPLRRLIVNPQFIFTLDHIHETRAWMAMWQAGLSGADRH